MTILKAALLFGLAPEDFVIAIRVERRGNVNQINASIGQFA
jgi:hypothetical protein